MEVIDTTGFQDNSDDCEVCGDPSENNHGSDECVIILVFLFVLLLLLLLFDGDGLFGDFRNRSRFVGQDAHLLQVQLVDLGHCDWGIDELHLTVLSDLSVSQTFSSGTFRTPRDIVQVAEGVDVQHVDVGWRQ
ncbi:hypothetical protein WICPIJ_009023 [Wickerhamomyces pijperi]|uniref:Uncharacterized protein n=1 Tax=Wickerhamomyces pijperi TaxID=599730 RepID=A0A9P8PTK6_WICPI|nr:hypothetical protein WICPIJ_009023 [Wickerhamomyces pijperi]